MNTQKTLDIKKWTQQQNEEFARLLDACYTGHYWANEGWTRHHEELLPEAENALEEWLNENV